MRSALLAIVFAVSAVCVHAEVRLFLWQESRDEKTGDKLFGFFLGPTAIMDWMEAKEKGDEKAADAFAEKLPSDSWMYALLLTGEEKIYRKDKIKLAEPKPCGDMLEVDSGTVEVDRKADTIRVALRVKQDGKLIDFIGNGKFSIRKSTIKP